jgi:hypothetical protein
LSLIQFITNLANTEAELGFEISQFLRCTTKKSVVISLRAPPNEITGTTFKRNQGSRKILEVGLAIELPEHISLSRFATPEVTSW